MTQHECVQLDHVLQMYHVGYHKGHRPSSIREPPVEPATSITVQHAGGLGSGRAPGALRQPKATPSRCSPTPRRRRGPPLPPFVPPSPSTRGGGGVPPPQHISADVARGGVSGAPHPPALRTRKSADSAWAAEHAAARPARWEWGLDCLYLLALRCYYECVNGEGDVVGEMLTPSRTSCRGRGYKAEKSAEENADRKRTR